MAKEGLNSRVTRKIDLRAMSSFGATQLNTSLAPQLCKEDNDDPRKRSAQQRRVPGEEDQREVP
jgi:hypothetical protein